MLLGVQRPDSSIIDGQIKSNIPFRVCGRFADPQPSIIVLGDKRAVELPNIPGRFIADNQEIQAYYFKAEQVINLRPHIINPKNSNIFETEQVEIPEMLKQRTERKIYGVKKCTSKTKKSLDLDFEDLDL